MKGKEDTMVRWIQIEKVSSAKDKFKLDKVEKTTSMASAVNQLCQELETLSRHRFNARWQAAQYQQLTSNVPEGTAVVTLDFSENYR